MTELAEMIAAHKDRAELIAAAYEAATPATRRAVELVVDRCKSGCLLLVCWQSPIGRIVRLPGYRLPPARTEAASVPSARAKNTTDGYRRWKARHLLIDEMADWGATVALDVNCEHMIGHMLSVTDVRADADAARPGAPTRRRI